ncbi:bidirectional sugar transporter SWEET14-like isoform X2 [Asparagus officinalis]|nr:bidirectional sugar transporter SWEET14-like isoform X2 [Asparagus officinalis]
MLWIYYALLKTEAEFLLTINGLGCIIESTYIIMYLIYAPRQAKVYTAKLLFLLNVGMFGLIVLVSLVFANGGDRVTILGWICVGFSVCVFVAPLSIIRLVIKTRSVEFMPFSLSLFLTFSAVAWFFYGFLSHDKYIAIPNILGFLFGLIQMVLYAVYMNTNANTTKCVDVEEVDMPEHIVTISKLGIVGQGAEVYPIDANKEKEEKEGGGGEEGKGKKCELTTIDVNNKESMGIHHEEAEV